MNPSNTPNNIPEGLDQDSFKGDELSDLKALKKIISDKNVDNKDINFISEHIDDIEGGARTALNQMLEGFVEEGFSAIDEKTYNSFKGLMKKSEYGFKIPDWNAIIKTIQDNTSFTDDGIKQERFHGVVLKEGVIHALYDGFGNDDTLEIKFDKNGVVDSNSTNWIETENEEEDVSSERKVGRSDLDSYINSAEVDSKLKARQESQAKKLAEQARKDLEHEAELTNQAQKLNQVETLATKLRTNLTDQAKQLENLEKFATELKANQDNQANVDARQDSQLEDQLSKLKEVESIAEKLKLNLVDQTEKLGKLEKIATELRKKLDEQTKSLEEQSNKDLELESELDSQSKKLQEIEPLATILREGLDSQSEKLKDLQSLATELKAVQDEQVNENEKQSTDIEANKDKNKAQDKAIENNTDNIDYLEYKTDKLHSDIWRLAEKRMDSRFPGTTTLKKVKFGNEKVKVELKKDRKGNITLKLDTPFIDGGIRDKDFETNMKEGFDPDDLLISMNTLLSKYSTELSKVKQEKINKKETKREKLRLEAPDLVKKLINGKRRRRVVVDSFDVEIKGRTETVKVEMKRNRKGEIYLTLDTPVRDGRIKDKDFYKLLVDTKKGGTYSIENFIKEEGSILEKEYRSKLEK